jgi:PqqD family protein of HPr-rel-A system
LRLQLTKRTLRERHWGEESVVFDTYSGETHHLDALASAIFRGISASGSIDLALLCAELARPGDSGDAPETSPEAIGSAAARLCHVGLILVDDSEP